jgi:uncharacterized Zn-finger protein
MLVVWFDNIAQKYQTCPFGYWWLDCQTRVDLLQEATRCARLSQEALMIGSSPANYISNEVKAYMEKQQSVIDRLTERMAIMKKETSDPQVFVTSENSAKVTCQFCDKSGYTSKQCLRIRIKAKEPIRCFNCGREGHKQTQCRSKRKSAPESSIALWRKCPTFIGI